MEQVKKYYVKHNYRFNMDSMRTHVMNLIDDIRDGKFETVELMGETMDEYRLEAFREELEDLMAKAYYPVCGKDYGRIKAISDDDTGTVQFCEAVRRHRQSKSCYDSYCDLLSRLYDIIPQGGRK